VPEGHRERGVCKNTCIIDQADKLVISRYPIPISSAVEYRLKKWSDNDSGVNNDGEKKKLPRRVALGDVHSNMLNSI
jgi:hypothetical protein